jgi:hypothetical protein
LAVTVNSFGESIQQLVEKARNRSSAAHARGRLDPRDLFLLATAAHRIYCFATAVAENQPSN